MNLEAAASSHLFTGHQRVNSRKVEAMQRANKSWAPRRGGSLRPSSVISRLQIDNFNVGQGKMFGAQSPRICGRMIAAARGGYIVVGMQKVRVLSLMSSAPYTLSDQAPVSVCRAGGGCPPASTTRFYLPSGSQRFTKFGR
jgi:hypothetical protein